MDWKELEKETPEEGKELWLFGIDENDGYERFDVGVRDKTYGVMTDRGPSMEITHWAYCEKPKI